MYQSEVLITGGFRNPYGIHQAMWSLFPADERANRDFLYRAQARDQRGRMRVLLQSVRQPQASTIARILQQKRCELQQDVTEGANHFVLIANPTKATKDGDVRRVHSRRIPLLDESERHQWLNRKLAGAAEVQQVVIQDLAPMRFRKPREDFRSGTIQPVLFVGDLKVIDKAQMMTLCQKGIGPAKGFGCGLLTLTPR